MPLQIRSTLIEEEIHSDAKARTALVELVVSDSAEQDKAVEILRLRTRVNISDSFLPAIQESAMLRTKTILDEVEGALRKYWEHVS